MKVPRDLADKCLELAGLSPVEGEAEAGFQAWVVRVARENGFEAYHTYDSRRSIGAGFPDLVLLKPGVLIVAELKVKRRKTTPEQEKWLALFATIPGVRVLRWRETDWQAIRKELEAA